MVLDRPKRRRSFHRARIEGGLEHLAHVVDEHDLELAANGGRNVVEVAPAYDGPGQITALLAANLLFEFVSLLARRR